MIARNLNYNYKDIFLAPRLALSGKKLFLILRGNLVGYIAYFLFSYVSLITNGLSVENIVLKYGLYPYLFGHEAEWYSWAIYSIGVAIWLFALLLCHSGVSRILLKQLKGNDFFSGQDGLKFVYKHWHAIVLTPLTLLLIVALFLVLAFAFAFFGKIPIIGYVTFPLLYIFYFFGSSFVIISFFVFVNSFLHTPSIVSIYEEDTMGSVFQIYSITLGQSWRIIFYNILLIFLIIICVEVFSWFCVNSIGLISIIFGHDFFMGNKFTLINSNALSVVLSNNFLELLTHYKNFIFHNLFLESGIPVILKTSMNTSYIENLSILGVVSSILLSAVYFIIGLLIVSYGISILSVGQSLMFITFKKLSDDDDVILRSDEDEDSDDLIFQKKFESKLENLSQDTFEKKEQN